MSIGKLYLRIVYTPDVRRTLNLLSEFTQHPLASLKQALETSSEVPVRRLFTDTHPRDALHCLHLLNSLDALAVSYELNLDGEVFGREGFHMALSRWDEIKTARGAEDDDPELI